MKMASPEGMDLNMSPPTWVIPAMTTRTVTHTAEVRMYGEWHLMISFKSSFPGHIHYDLYQEQLARL